MRRLAFALAAAAVGAALGQAPNRSSTADSFDDVDAFLAFVTGGAAERATVVASGMDIDGDDREDWVGIVLQPPKPGAGSRSAQLFVLLRDRDGRLRIDGRSPAFEFFGGGGRGWVEAVDVPARASFSVQFDTRQNNCMLAILRHTFRKDARGWRLVRQDYAEADACDPMADREVVIDQLTGQATLQTWKEGIKRTTATQLPASMYRLDDFDYAKPYGLERVLPP